MVGTEVSHYRILEKLGGGGMGVVYKAEDTHLRRHVALKFLPPDLTRDPEARERFVQEAQAASALDHPNICTIYEIGDSAEGQTFIAMAFYEGETLKKKVVQGPLPVEIAIDYARQIAEGLAAAHRRGIVHRDIKPANVMVTDEGRVKIVDFGLAKVQDVNLTKAGSTVGTVAYMSPEQARGEAVDHRTDIWSLGVVLYEMLTGQRPFRGDYEQAVLYAVLNQDPEQLTALCPDVQEASARVVHLALAKDADDRYPTMQALLEDLRSLEEPGRIVAAPPSIGVLLRQPRIAASALIVLVVLAALAVWQLRRSANVRWARQVALPEIERRVEKEQYREAFVLATEAERYIPNDSMLVRLWPRFSQYISVFTDPPGGQLYRKPYHRPDTAWTFLGETPLDSIRVYNGRTRWKLEREGFHTVHAFVSPGFLNRDRDVPIELDENGSIPEGMSRVAGWSFEILLPGLEHLERESINGFLMDTYEVTNEAYKQFVDSGGYQNQAYWQHPFIQDGRTLSWDKAMARLIDQTGQPGPATWELGDYPEGEDDYPVRGVSWYEAAAYAAFAGKRLPTVFHWNAAASTWRSSDIVPLSNFGSTGPAPAGQYQGMSWAGVYDLAGNVREWIWNEIDRDGQRLILGGAWNMATWTFNDARHLPPLDRSPENGFRCMQSLEPNDNQAALERVIELPFRDFLTAEPVSDETFAIFLRQFAYDKTPLNARVEARDEQEEDWIREQILFDAAYGSERVTAYLYLPKQGKPPYQTVVFFPGSNAIHRRSFYEGNEFERTDFLVKAGRAVLYPVYKSTYERGDGMTSDMQSATIDYKEHVIMWAKDLSRSIDYLETRDDIDMERLAYFGTSWGGVLGPIMLVVDPRLKAAVFRGAGMEFQPTLPETDPFNYLPRVTVPVLLLNGRYDFFFPVETTVNPFIDNLGTPSEHRVLRLYDTGHFVPRLELIKESLSWLDRYLGPVE